MIRKLDQITYLLNCEKVLTIEAMGGSPNILTKL